MSAAPDPADAATTRCTRRPARLHGVPEADALKGARIGIPRAFYYDPTADARCDGYDRCGWAAAGEAAAVAASATRRRS